MKGKKLWYIIGLIALAILAGLFWQNQKAMELDSIQAQKGSISITVEDTAVVQAAQDYDLYATQNAQVKSLKVEIGQRVEANTLLMELDNPGLQLELSENRSLLAQAQAQATAAAAAVNRLELQHQDAAANLGRSKELFHQGAISESEYEQAVLALNTAQEAWSEHNSYLDTLQSQIRGLNDSQEKLRQLEKELQVFSPIQGVVLELPVKTGQSLTPGLLLASLALGQDLEIKADILSDDLAQVQVGQRVSITAPVLEDKVLSGRVIKIYPRAEEKMSALGVIQRRVPIIISLSDRANLKPGYEVRVAIETKHLDNVITIPIESVRPQGEGKGQVMLIKDQRIVFNEVETGLSDGDRVEIKKGLNVGDLIVKDGSEELNPHTKVKPR